jgi:hypothetical protein
VGLIHDEQMIKAKMPMAAEGLWVPDETNDDTVNSKCTIFVCT